MGPATPTGQDHSTGPASAPTAGPSSAPLGPLSAQQRAAVRGPEAGAHGGARPGAERPALGNYTNTVGTPGQSHDPEADQRARDRRAERLSALRDLAELSGLERVRKCKRVSLIEGGEVHARTGKRASIAGLMACGSLWACPVCSATITSARATEVTRAIEWNTERGGDVALLTLTMRHRLGQPLPLLRAALTGAWRHMTQAREWTDTRRDLHLDHYVRAVEVTHGDNGWHLHIHAVLLFARPVQVAEVEALADGLFRAWSAGLAKHGMTALRAHAVDVRKGETALETLGKYLNKLAFEAAGGRFKTGRLGGRTPFEILADGLATGLAEDLELWLAWEQGSKGMRQLTWSRGLKAAAGVDDVTDEELAEREEPGVTFAVLPRATWRRVHREGQWHLLNATDAGGPDAGLAWLQVRGLAYTEVTDGLVGEHSEDPAEVVAARMVAGHGNARRNARWDALAERLERFGPAPARDLGGDHDA